MSAHLSSLLRTPPKEQIPDGVKARTLAEALAQLAANRLQVADAEAALRALLKQQAALQHTQRLLAEQRLLDVLGQGPSVFGVDSGRPAAAIVIYRSLVHWGGQELACSILEHVNHLLLQTTDEDFVAARHRNDTTDATAMTYDLAYGLSTMVVLVALVAPHIAYKGPVLAPGGASKAAARSAVGGSGHSVTERAAAVAQKMKQELQERMSATLGAFGKNLLLGRRAKQQQQPPAARQQPSPLPPPPQQPELVAQERPEMAGVEVERQASGSGSEEVLPADESLPSRSASLASGSISLPGAGVEQQQQQQQAAQLAIWRQNLDLAVQKCYNQVRDTLKRHVSILLPECIQAPPPPSTLVSPVAAGAAHKQAFAAAQHGGQYAEPAAGVFSLDDEDEDAGGTVAPAGGAAVLPLAGSSLAGVVEQVAVPNGGSSAPPPLSLAAQAQAQDLTAWVELVAVLEQHLDLMRKACVPRIVIKCIYKQVLRFVNNQLFNQLLLRPECCCTSNARYVVSGLQLLDEWVSGGGGQGGHEELKVLAEDLRHIRQASHFLLMTNKGSLMLGDIVTMCPSLNAQQLYRLATTFCDDTPLPPPPVHLAASPSAPVSVPAAAVDEMDPKEAEAEPAAVAVGTIDLLQLDEDDGEGRQGASASAEASKGAAAATATHDDDDARTPDSAVAGGEQPAVASPPATSAAAAAAAAAAGGAIPSPSATSPAPAAQPQHQHVGPGTSLSLSGAAAPAVGPPLDRNVSGEVLEDMKRQFSVSNNGGLIVTFLLTDEYDSQALIAPGGVLAQDLLRMVMEPGLQLPLRIPAALVDEDCPAQAFAFLEEALDGLQPHQP